MHRPRRLLVVLALCALAATLAACDSGGSPEPPDPTCTGPPAPSADGPLVPLAVGNSWTYERTYYQRPTPQTDTLRAEVTDKVRVSHDGDTYEAAVWGLYDPTATDRPGFPRPLRWNGPEGTYQLGGIAEADTFTTRFLQLQYPAEPGTEYDVPILAYDPPSPQGFVFSDTLTYRVDSTEATFTTPVGTFTSYIFHYKRRPAPDVGGFWHFKIYYAAGIGPIGLVVREDDGDLVSRRVLTDCHIRGS